jgi:hypothetical protein
MSSFPVDTACGLRDLVEAGFRAPACREIEIDACFHERGCNQAARCSRAKQLPHVI